MGQQLLTFEALATLGGAAFLTFIIVAYTKAIVQQKLGLPTDLYAVIVSTTIVILTQVGLGAATNDWRLYFLAMANGFLVALEAGKMNDKTVQEYVDGLRRDGSKHE